MTGILNTQRWRCVDLAVRVLRLTYDEFDQENQGRRSRGRMEALVEQGAKQSKVLWVRNPIPVPESLFCQVPVCKLSEPKLPAGALTVQHLQFYRSVSNLRGMRSRWHGYSIQITAAIHQVTEKDVQTPLEPIAALLRPSNFRLPKATYATLNK